MSTYTEDHLVEQPAIQLMHDELGWDVMNCFGEWDVGTSNLGRDGKREVVLGSRLKSALLALNPDLPVEAIEGAVEEVGILNDEFWILNGRGKQVLRVNPAPRFMVARLNEPGSNISRKTLTTNEFLFVWKTSGAVSSLGEIGRLSEIPIHKLIKSLFSRKRENDKNVKIGLPFTKNSLFTTT